MITRFLRIFLLFLPVWLLATPVLGAVSAEVDRTQLNAGETVQYRLRLEGNRPGEPNFAPLEEHFDIVSRSQSSQTRIINWKREEFREWTLVLAPKRKGIVVIPPIRVAGEQSQPITLRVAASGSVQGGGPANVQLEVFTEPEEAFVQSQVLLTVRVLHRYELEGNLTEPEIPNAVVEKLGDQRSYSELREGVRFQITERRYALFPQQSGPLAIPSLVLTGTLMQQAPGFGFNPFGPTRGGTTIRLRSDPLEILVRPRPLQWPDARPWLPAEQLTLAASWTPDHLKVRAGEPLVLQLTTRAEGLSATQLPAPRIEWPAGLQVYPDKAVQDNVLDWEGVTGTRVDRFTVIPAHGGRFVVPGIRVYWWNTQAQRAESAEVPVTPLQIEGVPAPVTTTAPSADGPVTTTPPALVPGPAPVRAASPWPWVLSVLLAAAWLATLVLLLRERRYRTPRPREAGDGETNDHAAWHLLARACRNADAAGAYAAMLQWLRQLPAGEAAAWERLLHDPGGKSEVSRHWRALDRRLHGPEHSPGDWDADALFRSLKAMRKEIRARASRKPGPLPPLHPGTAAG